MAITISDQNFQELLDSGKPLVVDFSAEWCGPCKMVAPLIEEAASTYEGRIHIGKVDVDNGDDIVGQFSVRNIPTLLFFKEGKLVDKHVGAIAKPALIQKIESIL